MYEYITSFRKLDNPLILTTHSKICFLFSVPRLIIASFYLTNKPICLKL